MNAELDDHLGYGKYQSKINHNSRNGDTHKTVYGENEALEIQTPRDRAGEFLPQIIKNRQTRLPKPDAKIVYLYSQGLTTLEISQTLSEAYETEVSPTLVSRVTDAINTVFPQTAIQLCTVHMVRNLLKFVAWKDYKEITADLKQIYNAETEDKARLALEAFAGRWDKKYPQISKSWVENWENLSTIFAYSAQICKAIYTTNAIESLNNVIRKAIKKRKHFPSDEAATKVVYLAIQNASKKWSMPIRNWKPALNRFMIDFEERLTDLN